MEGVKISEVPVLRDGKWFQIEDSSYMPLQTGSKAGWHSNMCFYLSVCLGNEEKALSLKKSLVPLANSAALQRGRLIDFGLCKQMAEDEICMAYAKLKGPITVITCDDHLLKASVCSPRTRI